MDLHLTDEQAVLLLAELDQIIENDRYPLSRRIRALREIRACCRLDTQLCRPCNYRC
jgi:hypothetical protein